MSNLSTEKTPKSNRCECYKKLQYLGIPLHKSDEEEYGEIRKEILYENCFSLPGILNINPKVTQYPIVNEYNLADTFREMALVIPNLDDFEQNILSFWIMDMFLEGLWTAQRAGMHHNHQKATLQWIAYCFNYIQRNNPTRKELFKHLKKLVFRCENKQVEYPGEDSERGFFDDSDSSVTEEGGEDDSITGYVYELPLPPGTKNAFAESDTNISGSFSEQLGEEEEKSIPTPSYSIGEENHSERNCNHMQIILEILYRIFARLGVFMEMQAVFHHMPLVELVNLPFSLNIPKPAPKVDPFALPDDENGVKMSPTLEGFLSNKLEMEKILHRNYYILPLQVAEESKAYVKQVFAATPSADSTIGKGKDRKKSIHG